MTALHEAIEYSALGWVKPELDETLRLVRVEVEGFADDPSDTSRMRVCTELLHQVQGTLRMVELYAPAMVAEEMERLSVALQNGEDIAGHSLDRDVACSALMRGVVLLPDYLERLQSGHKEISIVLLPMLNELRAARGEAGLSESVLFVPDLDRALPASLPRIAAQSASARANDVAPYLARLRDALRAWPEQGAPGDTDGLHFAAEALLARAADESQRRMLWVASMVAVALRDETDGRLSFPYHADQFGQEQPGELPAVEAFAQEVSTGEDNPIVVTLSGSDPDGDPITFIVFGTISFNPRKQFIKYNINIFHKTIVPAIHRQ